MSTCRGYGRGSVRGGTGGCSTGQGLGGPGCAWSGRGRQGTLSFKDCGRGHGKHPGRGWSSLLGAGAALVGEARRGPRCASYGIADMQCHREPHCASPEAACEPNDRPQNPSQNPTIPPHPGPTAPDLGHRTPPPHIIWHCRPICSAVGSAIVCHHGHHASLKTGTQIQIQMGPTPPPPPPPHHLHTH